MVKITLRERESVQEAVRRFRKIVERSGLKRELRRRERFEKPSDIKSQGQDAGHSPIQVSGSGQVAFGYHKVAPT